jgi:toxin HigB-1
VEVTFAAERLIRLCESQDALQRAYGKPCAAKVMARLADLRAALTLEEFRLLPGHCHELVGDRKDQLALDLVGGRRLVFEPAHNPRPLTQGGGLDWGRVEAVLVIGIVDYHRG